MPCACSYNTTRLPYQKDEAFGCAILRNERFLRIGKHESKLIVKFQRRHHLHDFLGKKMVAGQKPLDVFAMHGSGKALTPVGENGGNHPMRLRERVDRFL